MIVSGVNGYELQRIIDGINKHYQTSMVFYDMVTYSVKLRNRTKQVVRVVPRARFALRLQDSADPFHKRSGKRRSRTRCVCWHGMALFMMRLFRAHPNAKLKTSLLRYSDLDDFLAKFKSTGKGKGEVRYDELCDCRQGTQEFVWAVVQELFVVG